MGTVILIYAALLFFKLCFAAEFTEEALVLETFNNEQLYAVFNFSTISSNLRAFERHHYDLFPRSVGELVQKYGVAEFHLSMTQGLWRYEKWGYPDFPAPPGAQLWVWFNPEVQSVDEAWYGFTNALSGLLCASLNFIGKTETASPKLSFRPEGVVSDDSRSLLRHAVLSRENLCTENLTPWLKLLPCGSSSGIGWLLNPARLHHTQFLSLGLQFKRTCDNEAECDKPALNMHQSVSTVFDIRTSTKMKPDFSLENVLDRRIKGACPLARRSMLKLSVPQGTGIQPSPKYMEGSFAVYDLATQNLRSIEVYWEKVPPFERPEVPALIGHCHLAGFGQEDGGVRCRLSNGAEHNISVVVMHTVPWFLQVYLHTLEIKNEIGEQLPIRHLTFHPAKIRRSPHFLEYVLIVPQASTAEIAFQFSRGFLTWTEHPPDANHGFYIGSTVVSVRNKDVDIGSNDLVHRLYTEALQVHIPVPDFSMPYNVICLACTVLAIAFGSLHNLTTRRIQKVDPESAKKNFLQKVLTIIKQFLYRDKGKVTGDAHGKMEEHSKSN